VGEVDRWARARRQEFLRVAGLDPGTRFEDPHAFVELIQELLDKGSANVVLDVRRGQLDRWPNPGYC
jgi:hypothetical protein